MFYYRHEELNYYRLCIAKILEQLNSGVNPDPEKLLNLRDLAFLYGSYEQIESMVNMLLDYNLATVVISRGGRVSYQCGYVQPTRDYEKIIEAGGILRTFPNMVVRILTLPNHDNIFFVQKFDPEVKYRQDWVELIDGSVYYLRDDFDMLN